MLLFCLLFVVADIVSVGGVCEDGKQKPRDPEESAVMPGGVGRCREGV